MKIQQILSLFNLRDIETKLFEVLFNNGIMSASDIAKQLNISRTSVYDLLDRLIKVELISETLKGGVKMFVVQPPEKIQLLLQEKQKEILSAQSMLKELEKEYQGKQKSFKPKFQLFEGREEVQQMMKDLLLYRDITVRAFWPIKKMLDLLTPEFVEKFHQERIERNIKLKVIWPKSESSLVKQYKFLKISQEQKREARFASADIDFSLGYAVYGQTVRFLSSSKENFGFLIESKELAEVMISQFNILWLASK